jgi:long-chain acyl-CoA synthetase
MHPDAHALNAPDKPACVLASTGQTLGYADLAAASNQGARLLRRLGLQRGDVAAALLDNGLEIFELAWAAQKAGLYLTCLSTKTSAADAAYILRDSGAKVIVASSRFASLVAEAVAGLDIQTWSVGDPSPLADWATVRSSLDASPLPDASPGADMLYSSGTTGRPKGVKPPLPDGPVDAPTPLTAMGQALYGLDDQTVYLSTSPLYHAAPLRWAMTVHRLGGTVVIMEQFDAEEALRLIERYRISVATWVPTHFVRLLKLPQERRDAYDTRSLRAVIHAAAPCPVEIKRRMIDWWGPIVHEYYSGTEACGITALSAEEWLRKPGSVGKAVLGVVKIVDENGEPLPVGEVGEVYFADGPRFAYHNDPDKTARAYNARGWATLGDIGRLDEDGYLYLTDRKSFMIISGGVNIYPQEIENLLTTHEAVADVAVIGAPDEEMGERVVAVVQPVDMALAGPDLAETLRGFVRQRLGGVKTPRQIDFRATLPREPTGKLLKRLLRDEYQASPERAVAFQTESAT